MPRRPQPKIVNERLRAAVETIILETLRRRTKEGSPDYLKVGQDLDMSQSALNAVRYGGEPKASTLLRFARHAGVNPLRLYQLAGWFEPEDVFRYVSELSAEGVYAIRDDPAQLAALLSLTEMTEEELRVLAATAQPILDVLAERRVDRARLLLRGDDAAGGSPALASVSPGAQPD